MGKNLKNKKKHLQKEERFCIEKMLKQGKSFSEMARVLGRGLSTISEEVNENGGRRKYQAEQAHHRAYLKQYWKKRNCNKVAMNSNLSKFVEKKLRLGWSPETISMRLEIQSGLPYASGKSIRKFVGKRPSLEQFLFWERNKLKTGRKRRKDYYLNDLERKFVELRPLSALYEYGHWEMDFIVSKHNAYVLLVVVDMVSKFSRVIKLPNRKRSTILGALSVVFRGIPIKSITTDNDIAFVCWKDIESSLHTQVYFTHPYHSWEKGLVENTNRWIRCFVKKRRDISTVTEKELQEIHSFLNHRPREIIDFRSPFEVYYKLTSVLIEG